MKFISKSMDIAFCIIISLCIGFGAVILLSYMGLI